MKNKNWLILVAVVVMGMSSLACGGGTAEVPTNNNVESVTEETQESAPTAVPSKLADIAVMQGGIVVHKDAGYVMDSQNIPQETLDKRATCFTALAKGETSESCTANLTGEFERMPGVCTLSPKAEAGKTGICSYVAK